MVRRRTSFLVIFFSFLNVSLTFSQTLNGRVVNDNDQPVIGALIEIIDTDKAAFTNATGRFTIAELTSGSYSIKITMDGFNDYMATIQQGKEDQDLGDIMITGSTDQIQDDQTDIAIINIGDLASSEENDVAISSILTSGQDVFEDAASYNFWSARFRQRGYDNERTDLYINGMRMNDLDDGRIYWSAWGGLNDVMRNRNSELSLRPTSIGFGGIGGSSSIDLSPSAQRPGTRVRYSFGNRSYVHRLAITHNSGELESGWSYSLSASRRYASEGYIQGTFYDSWAYFLGVEKELNQDQRLSLIIMGSPLKRGRSSGSVQEAYDITGNVYYNPNWGYQNGEKRNARAYRSHLPTGILQHKWNISEKTRLVTSLGYQTGRYGTTGLDWFLAPDPRPDYYRKLPSWQETEESRALVEEFFRNNPSAMQLQWDRFYETNKNKVTTVRDVDGIPGNDVTGRLSSYIIEEQRFDNNRFSFNTQLESIISSNFQLTIGLQHHQEVAENFKTLEDLLGGEFYIDYDEFAIRDFPGEIDIIQNDLNNPNRLLSEGDVFGWDYDVRSRRSTAWGQGEYIGTKMDFHIGLELSQNAFFRRGYTKVGKFPDNSEGDSEQQSFTTYGVKGGLTYKIDGRNYLYANGTYRTQSPYPRFSFLSPRTRDEIVNDLTNETIFGGEAGYILRFPSLKGRVSAYYTEFRDQIESISFYHDEERTFVNYVMNGVDKRHMGLELGIEGNLTSTLSVEVVGALGEYIYNSRPRATISQDNNAEKIDEDRLVYLKNFYVPGTPQTAGTIGLNYRSPQFWFVNLNVNYFDRAYLDFNPDRRTAVGVELVNREEQPELWSSIIDQQRLDSQMTVDIFAGKSWRVDDYYIAANLSVNNILNNQEFITGGFEQYRFDYETKDINTFPPRLFYAYGINYSLNVSVSF